MTGKPMYLDMQSTTPVDPRVLDSMLPYFIGQVGSERGLFVMCGVVGLLASTQMCTRGESHCIRILQPDAANSPRFYKCVRPCTWLPSAMPAAHFPPSP